jgi:hypothetical protein
VRSRVRPRDTKADADSAGTNQNLRAVRNPRAGRGGEPSTTTGDGVVESTTVGETDDFFGSCALFDWTDGHLGYDIAVSWTPPSSGDYCIDTNGSAMLDTVLYVIDEHCSEELACDDDGGDGSDSALTLSAAAGTDYLIVVNESRATSGGEFVLNINEGTCP